MPLRSWRLRIPTYFVVAVVIHLLLGGLSFTVYLGGDVVARVKQRVSEMLVFTHISREALVRSRQTASAPASALGASDAVPLATPATPALERATLAPVDLSGIPTTALAPPAITSSAARDFAMPLPPALGAESPAMDLAPLTLPAVTQREIAAETVPLEAVAVRPAPLAETAATPLALERAAPAPVMTPAAQLVAPSGRGAVATMSPAKLGPPAEIPVMSDKSAAGDLALSLAGRTRDVAEDAIALEVAPPSAKPPAQAAAVAPLDIPLPRAPRPPVGEPVAGATSVTRPVAAAATIARPTTDLALPLLAASSAPHPPETFGPKAPRRLVAEDNIGLTALLQLRQGRAKQDALEAFGGNHETLTAVRRGLEWLARHQHGDGYWSLHAFHQQCQGHECPQRGQIQSDPAATGLALMAFLGDGHAPAEGDFQGAVKRGLVWLVGQQHKDGDLAHGVGQNAHLYSHGIATIALCEAYAMSKDEKWREPAQRAIAFIVAAQHQASGGWRYEPNQSADTSVVGWQVMALKSAQMAGLDVPPATLTNVRRWLTSVERQGNERGRFGYLSRDNSYAMTAEALLCLEYLGVPRDDPSLVGGVNFLLTRLPKDKEETSYYWYYGTQAMYHVGGEPWQKWNAALRDVLLATQIKDGHQAGTWEVRDNWEQQGGRIYATTLRVLMLESYYRHLPLY